MSRVVPIPLPLVAAALLVAAASPATAVTDAASPEPPSTSSIAGQVWDDVDGDGLRAPDEPPVPDVTVELWADGDADGALDSVLTTATTDGDGRYLFDGLDPSVDHAVRFVAPDGGSFTGRDVGDDGVDSDADPASGRTAVVVLQPGEALTTVDAGLATEGPIDVATSPPTTPITGRVWSDEDGDGLRDEGEPGVPDVQVHLWTDDDGDGAPDTLVASTTTGDGGGYLLAVPDPALAYLVEFDDREPLTAKDVGTDDAIDSDPDPATRFTDVITFDGTVDTANVDAGMRLVIVTVHPPATWIGGRVWLDADFDGIQDDGEPDQPGVAVVLWSDDGDGTAGSRIATTTTGDDGRYRFDDLDPTIRYLVQFASGTEFTRQDAGDDDSLDSDVDPGTGLTDPIELVDPRVFDPTTVDAGLVILFPTHADAFASGRVWEDEDGDGIQDAAESGVPGVDVDVWLDADGDGVPDTRIAGTVTFADGRYEVEFPVPFERGEAPSYFIEVVEPSGFVLTSRDVGDDDSVDSDVDPITGLSAPDESSVDAGLVGPVGSSTGPPDELPPMGAGTRSAVAVALGTLLSGVALLAGDRRRSDRVREA